MCPLGTECTFTWEHGRQLASQIFNGSTWTYTYNADGMRTGRTNGTNSYEYIYNGSQLMRMVRDDVVVDFTYINGIPATISFNGNTFYYVVNGQGDVTGITDSQGNLQLSYYYDAWGTPYYIYATGNTYGSTLLTTNPLMYRGYVYDRELGMYYLQSRYYIPQIGRFLNADGLVSTGQGVLGNNMFAYCGNNPVCRIDPSGNNWSALCLAIEAVVEFVDCALTLILSPVLAQGNPRSDLANAPDLDISTADPNTYNCYGNGIGKQILANPSGYVAGDSTRKTFEAVQRDLGSGNVRELNASSDPIGDDEFVVAMKCGPLDYHFIRLTDEGWYNKSGTLPGIFIAPIVVQRDIWYSMGMINGMGYVFSNVFYDDETIYFAVKVGWDD